MGEVARSAIESAIFYLIVFGLAVLVLRIFKVKTTKKDLGVIDFPTWKDILLAIAGFIIYLLFAALLTSIFSLFPWFDAEQAQDVGFNNILGTSDLIITFITLVVVAPIAEELIFRGLLYGKLRKKLTKGWGVALAIIITSVIFGLMHGQWNVGVNVFAMSVVMCLQRELTGTIYSGIILHMIKNAIAFYILYLMI